MLQEVFVGFVHRKIKDDNFKKVDMVYILPQLIASAMPTDGYIQSLYHMKADTLHSFLTRYHGENWHIWNLQEDHELGYDTANFAQRNVGGLVTRYPIQDHNPTSFTRLVKIVFEIHEFISAHTSNVAVVHCKCGKGRTGSIVTSYMMIYNNMSYDEATRMFTEKRIRLKAIDGVSIRSQLRYLKYVEYWVKTDMPTLLLKPTIIKIKRITITDTRIENFNIYLEAVNNEEQVMDDPNLNWDTNSKPRSIILRPIGPALLPNDIMLSFTGHRKLKSFTLPVCKVKYSFNAVIEAHLLLQNGDRKCFNEVGLSQVESKKLDHNLQIGEFKTFKKQDITENCLVDKEYKHTFHWNDTDGFMGTGFRGEQAFESMEILYSIMSEN